MTQVLVIQHAPDDEVELGLFADLLEEAGVGWTVIDTSAGAPVPENLEPSYAGIIFLGGMMGVYEQEEHPYLTDEIRLLQRCVSEDRPILGMCLGCQLLAAALGGEVYVAPHKEIGWHEVTLTDKAASDPLFSGMPRTFQAYHWHGDHFELPTGAVRLAYSKLAPNQAFRYGHCAWGIQFHPEVRAAEIHDWNAKYPRQVREAGESPEQIDDATPRLLPAQQEIARMLVHRWLAVATA